VEATGRRVGSVRQLRWEDLDFARGRIRFRAATDKKRRELGVPMPASLVDEVKRARAAIAELAGLQALQGVVFYAATDSARAVRRDVLDRWLEAAERKAGLEKLEGDCGTPTGGSGPPSASITRSRTSRLSVGGRTPGRCSPATRRPRTRRCSR
jgi:integrase